MQNKIFDSSDTYKIKMCSKAKVKLGLEREHKARQSSKPVEKRAAHGRRLEADIIKGL